MDEASITQYIIDTFDDIQTLTVTGTTFFFYDPKQKFPFATMVTNDDNDPYSDLNRPSAFRLNIGISKATYLSLFGAQTSPSRAKEVVDNGYDFTALDQLMPHPVYGRMYWVCVLNPSAATFQKVVKPLLAEAYALDVGKYTRVKE